MTLVGSPGIGKSRLLFELWSASTRTRPAIRYWRQGRSLPYGEGVSFWALGEMVKAQAGILESDASDAAAEKLRTAVAAVVDDEVEARWVLEHLRPLVGLGGPLQDAGDHRREAFGAWRRFFEALAEQRPLVLVFEDLHWADDGLLDFVDHLVDWSSGVPILVVCTSRPELLERRPGWGGGKRSAVTVSLSPLSDEETEQLLSALLAEKTVQNGRAARLLAHAGGNPLYAEEYVRMLAEPFAGPELPLPETVQGIIAARLDTLAAEEKALLQSAAVVGKVFWVGSLTAVSGRPRDEVEEGLLRLERKEFVRRERRSSVAGETAFVFRHVLVRDVAYSQIPRARRAEAHRLAAEWLEGLAGDRAEDQADLIAHHYLSALQFARASGRDLDDLRERARHALLEAGDRAHGALRLRGGGALLPGGAGLLARGRRRAASPAPPLRAGALPRGGTGADVLAEAAAELLDAGELEPAAEAEVLLADLLMISHGRRDEAAAHLDHAASLLAERPPSRPKVRVLASSANFHLAVDEAEEAMAAAGAALEMAEALGLAGLRAHALSTRGFSRVMTGDLEGLRDLRESVDVAAAANSPQAARGYNNLASVTADLGDLPKAFELYEQSRRVAERFGDAIALGWLEVERAYELYWGGEWDSALELCERLLTAEDEGSASLHEFDALLLRGKIVLAREGAEQALADVERASGLARGVGAPQMLLPALAFEAHALVAAGRGDESGRAADELLRLWLEEGRGFSLASFWLADLAFALAGLDRAGELAPVAGRTPTRTRWLDAAEAAGGGDWPIAAGIYARIGSLPDEALARTRAAADLARADRRAEADDQLRRASDFYRRAGAPTPALAPSK